MLTQLRNRTPAYFAVEYGSDVWVSWDHPPDDDGDKRPIDARRNLSTEAESFGVIVGNDRDRPIRNVTLTLTETPAAVETSLGETYAGAPSPENVAFWPAIEAGEFGPVLAQLEVDGLEAARGDLTALVTFENPEGDRYARTDTLSVQTEASNRAPSAGSLAAIVLGITALGRALPGRG